MTYPISLVGRVPKFETLPLLKITDYPLEKRDYKPFAQARLCCSEETFFVRMWAFEALVIEKSALVAQLSFDSSLRYLELTFTTGEPHALRLMEQGRCLQTLPPEACRVHEFCGEDLQGVYWGATAELPCTLIRSYFPDASLQKGGLVRGNLHKVCPSGEWEHHGSLFPCDPLAASPTPYFGTWELVSY